MPFDGLVLSAVRQELQKQILGARVDRVYQPDKETVVLHLRHQGITRFLLCSAHARHARLHLTAAPPPNPASPPVFCMVLRKHLEGGRITEVSQPGLERQLTLMVSGTDELGRPVTLALTCEVMGKHSNLILFSPETGLILDGMKRYSHLVSRYREVLPGKPYLPPPPQEKLALFSLGEEEIRAALLSLPLSTPLSEALFKKVEGLSPLLARELVARSAPGDPPLELCGELELSRLWQQLRDLARATEQGEFTPTVVWREGVPLEFAAVELRQFAGLEQRRFQEMSAALDFFFAARQEAEALEKKRQELLAAVGQHIRRLEKKAALQQEEVEKAAGAEAHRLAGELITANIYRLARGEELLVAENFHDPAGRSLEIHLDSQLTPAQNAQAYFKKYSRTIRGARQAGEQLAKTREELDYLESVRFFLERAEEPAQLAEGREELEAADYLKPRQPEGKKGGRGRGVKNREAAGPGLPLKFLSSDGFSILVGRNNRQNDYLTTRLAAPEDLWLHARGMPGAHVLIKKEGREAPQRTLLQAALLAAHFSRGRHSGKVEVDATERRYVRKPPGARPGLALYDHQETILVTPAGEELERLLAQQKSRDE